MVWYNNVICPITNNSASLPLCLNFLEERRSNSFPLLRKKGEKRTEIIFNCLLPPPARKPYGFSVIIFVPQVRGIFASLLGLGLVLFFWGLWENEILPLQMFLFSMFLFFVPLKLQSIWNTTTRKRKHFCLIPFLPLKPQAESLLTETGVGGGQ